LTGISGSTLGSGCSASGAGASLVADGRSDPAACGSAPSHPASSMPPAAAMIITEKILCFMEVPSHRFAPPIGQRADDALPAARVVSVEITV